jgi:hypothetical protein
VNLSEFYSYRLIGKLTTFLQLQKFCQQSDRGFFHYLHAVFSPVLKSRVGNILVKAASLRINLNIDGVSITSKSQTHLSHS